MYTSQHTQPVGKKVSIDSGKNYTLENYFRKETPRSKGCTVNLAAFYPPASYKRETYTIGKTYPDFIHKKPNATQYDKPKKVSYEESSQASDYTDYTTTEEETPIQQEETVTIPSDIFDLPKEAITAFETCNLDGQGITNWKYVPQFHQPGNKASPFDLGHYYSDMNDAFQTVKAIAGPEFSTAFEKEYNKVWKFLSDWFAEQRLDIKIALANDFQSTASSQEVPKSPLASE